MGGIGVRLRCKRGRRSPVAWVAVVCFFGSTALRGQTGQARSDLATREYADRGPVFFAIPAAGAARVDARDSAPMRRRVSLELLQVPLPAALREITKQSGVRFVYEPELVDSAARVTLEAQNIRLSAALTELLSDVGLDVEVTSANQATLVRHGVAAILPRARSQGSGTVTGHVTDAVLKTPLSDVSVRIDGTTRGATASADGNYTITGLAPGTYRVTARRVAYQLLSKDVTVAADQKVTLDFALAAAPTRLDEIVTTATGNERRLEVGNAIATINADSVAKTAPVLGLTDIISGRASNVDVEPASGEVGSGPRIRIRGLSSASLSNDPILIIDGVRANSAPGMLNAAFGANSAFDVNTPSRLNDIDPAEIESIEILKGPSAATLYGTDAANGVIVIKTHPGQAGAPRWDFAAEHGGGMVPTNRVPQRYYGWGHTTDGTNTPVDCSQADPNSFSLAAKTCTLDSVTAFQPLDHPSTSIFGPGNMNRLTGQVSGGAGTTVYSVSGSITDQLGELRLPDAFIPQAKAQGLAITSSFLHPNTMDQKSLHGRLNTVLARNLDMSFSSAYVSSGQNGTQSSYTLLGALVGSGVRDPVHYGYNTFGGYSPLANFRATATEGLDRFTNGGTLTWHPTPWLAAHATGGLDVSSQSDVGHYPVGNDQTNVTANPVSGAAGNGFSSIERLTTTLYTVDLGAAFTPALSGPVSSRTAVGLQYNDSRQAGTIAMAYGLSQNGSLNGAATQVNTQLGAEAVTAGTYIEETIGLHDRLYLTGALREDAGSGFGTQTNAALYPKASLSWALWRSGENSLRLRAAYGASGVQPQPGATLSLYSPVTAVVDGVAVTADTAITLANARLRPERQTEIETGLDAALLGGRLSVEATYYDKLSHDALVPVTVAASAGYLTSEENIGSVRNNGVELGISAEVVRTRAFSWLVNLSGSINANRLVSLAPGVSPIIGGQYGAQYRQTPGFPLFGYWAQQLIYSDANHDGFIEPGEVSLSDSNSYVGQSLPPRQAALNTTFTLWHGHLRVGVQFDGRGGNKLYDLARYFAEDGGPGAAALYAPRALPADQARAVANNVFFTPFAAYIEDASFVRWRELSITYPLALSWIRHVGARSMSITVAGRNLALWTRYPGLDPEVNTLTSVAPADFVQDQGAVPQVRSWLLRVNAGW